MSPPGSTRTPLRRGFFVSDSHDLRRQARGGRHPVPSPRRLRAPWRCALTRPANIALAVLRTYGEAPGKHDVRLRVLPRVRRSHSDWYLPTGYSQRRSHGRSVAWWFGTAAPAKTDTGVESDSTDRRRDEVARCPSQAIPALSAWFGPFLLRSALCLRSKHKGHSAFLSIRHGKKINCVQNRHGVHILMHNLALYKSYTYLSSTYSVNCVVTSLPT